MITPHDDTIVALATPPGTGAIAVIRLSGERSLQMISDVFISKSEMKKKFENIKSHTVHYGMIKDSEVMMDEVLISIFRKPHSYTGEDVIEISCHGSVYVQQQIINLLLKKGARLAVAGEFTLRAFLNGKMDLSQAEAVADLIASDNESRHRIAMQQMRGGYSDEIKKLRDELIHFASLIELELDFSEEDVEFADRQQLKKLVSGLQSAVSGLLESFELGNVIKNGIPVVIAGKPNVGKSTLLNVLLNEDRAIVSEIPGTTRDTIEEEINLSGIKFRFIDTAGIRETKDVIESIGVQKTFEKIGQSAIIIYMVDPSGMTVTELKTVLGDIQSQVKDAHPVIIPLINKIDLHDEEKIKSSYHEIENLICISAKNKSGIDLLISKLLHTVSHSKINYNSVIVANSRHAEALQNTNTSLAGVLKGLDEGITNDFIASDIRQALYHLGLITGEVTTDTLLQNIFSRFCIGK